VVAVQVDMLDMLAVSTLPHSEMTIQVEKEAMEGVEDVEWEVVEVDVGHLAYSGVGCSVHTDVCRVRWYISEVINEV
jgi:hypothetical protein